MENFLFFTAWPMTPPTPYSCFHIIFSIIGILTAFCAARLLSRRFLISSSGILFFCGLFLAAAELYKQSFLYVVVNNLSFDWWYFPFQLCSVPMYLCLLYPVFSPEKGGKVIAAFLQDFGFLGGIMALIQPSGLMHPYWTLTIHGFLWHFILIFLGFYCRFRRLSDQSPAGFKKTLPLFFVCCLIATAINVLAGPSANADMFYISPYFPSVQAVFHTIALHTGILPGNLAYLACVCIGARIVHNPVPKRLITIYRAKG